MGGIKLQGQAQAVYDKATQNPDFEGSLEKEGGNFKVWNSRWFILKDHYLYYTVKKGENPQGIILLQGASVEHKDLPSRPHSIALRTTKSFSIDGAWENRTYLFSSKTNAEIQKWLEKIAKAIQNASQQDTYKFTASSTSNHETRNSKGHSTDLPVVEQEEQIETSSIPTPSTATEQDTTKHDSTIENLLFTLDLLKTTDITEPNHEIEEQTKLVNSNMELRQQITDSSQQNTKLTERIQQLEGQIDVLEQLSTSQLQEFLEIHNKAIANIQTVLQKRQ